MKKKSKIIILILIGLLISILSIYIIDIYRFNNNQKPLITLGITIKDYNDGSVTEYNSIGYKFVEYDREWIKGYKKEFIYGKQKNLLTEQFEISVNNYTPCNNDLTFYVQSYRSYYLSCINNITVSFRNGVNKELKDAFQEGMITIYDIINKTSDKTDYLNNDETVYTFKNYKILICNNRIIFGDLNLNITEDLCNTYLTGTINKINNKTITLTLDEEYSNIGDIITFNTDNTYQVGDKLKVYYTGEILEIYPPIIKDVIKIEVIK